MNKHALDLVRLATEDLKEGLGVSAFIDGPGWVRVGSIMYDKDDDLISVTDPDEETSILSAPASRLAAIKCYELNYGLSA